MFGLPFYWRQTALRNNGFLKPSSYTNFWIPPGKKKKKIQCCISLLPLFYLCLLLSQRLLSLHQKHSRSQLIPLSCATVSLRHCHCLLQNLFTVTPARAFSETHPPRSTCTLTPVPNLQNMSVHEFFFSCLWICREAERWCLLLMMLLCGGIIVAGDAEVQSWALAEAFWWRGRVRRWPS